MLLIRQCDNYADEFNTEGFIITSEKKWEQHLKEVEEQEFPLELYFGSNEFLGFDTFADYENSFSVEELSKEEVKVLKKFFGNSKFGIIVLAETEVEL